MIEHHMIWINMNERFFLKRRSLVETAIVYAFSTSSDNFAYTDFLGIYIYIFLNTYAKAIFRFQVGSSISVICSWDWLANHWQGLVIAKLGRRIVGDRSPKNWWARYNIQPSWKTSTLTAIVFLSYSPAWGAASCLNKSRIEWLIKMFFSETCRPAEVTVLWFFQRFWNLRRHPLKTKNRNPKPRHMSMNGQASVKRPYSQIPNREFQGLFLHFASGCFTLLHPDAVCVSRQICRDFCKGARVKKIHFRHEDATMAALSCTIWDFCSSELHLEV